MTLPTGIDYDALQRTLQHWVVSGSGLPAAKVYWGGQALPRPKAPAIELRLSNDAESTKAWADVVDNPLTFSQLTVTAVDSTTDKVTSVAHGMLTGDGPVHVSGTLPSPLQVNKDYWLVSPDADHLQFCDSYVHTGGGQGSTNPITVIDLVTAPAGTFTISAVDRTVRAGQELATVSRSYERMTLELHCYTNEGVGMNTATSILQRVRSRRMLPSQREALRAAKIGMLFTERIRAIQGVRDAVLFEPRAYLDIQLNVPCEVAEPTTIIRRAELTSTSPISDVLVDGGD